MASIRSLVPPARFILTSRQLQHRLAIRHASNIPKPRVLEKPERFNPPSHPSRLRAKRPTYGAPLSEQEREAQKTRRYPHMMPPEGTFLHWFLTNRSIHLWITMGILVSLTVGVWWQNFIHTTPYADLLPPNNLFLSHPFKAIRRYIEVYDMHLSYQTEQVKDRRKRNIEDVKKRSEYRKAHGLDGAEGSMFGGWSAKEDDEVLGPALREGGIPPLPADEASPVAMPTIQSVEDAKSSQNTYVDFEGNPRPSKPWYQFW